MSSFGVIVLVWNHGLFDFHGTSDFRKFHDKLKLVDVLAIKFNEFHSLARISLPVAPRPGWGPGPPRRRNEIQPAFSFWLEKLAFIVDVVFALFVTFISLSDMLLW